MKKRRDDDQAQQTKEKSSSKPFEKEAETELLAIFVPRHERNSDSSIDRKMQRKIGKKHQCV
jgi:hypothetical protein